MLSDPIADMLTRIRNASAVAKKEAVIPFSKQCEAIAKILAKEGYLADIKYQKIEVKNKKIKRLICQLKYEGKKPAITHLERVSRPGLRVYLPYKKIHQVLSGFGLAIISTSAGMMSNKEARKRKLGGEVICKIW